MAERTPNSSDALPIIGQPFLNAITEKRTDLHTITDRLH